MYKIVILMFLPFAQLNENDALTVTHLDGKILEFKTIEKCYEHVHENIDNLRKFADQWYPDTTIARIDCFEKYDERAKV